MNNHYKAFLYACIIWITIAALIGLLYIASTHFWLLLVLVGIGIFWLTHTIIMDYLDHG